MSAKPNAMSLLHQALDHHEAGRFAEAARLYEQLLKAFPNDINGLTNYGLLCLQHGQPARTIPLIEKSLTLYPKQPQARVDLATALRTTGQPEQALAQAQRAIALEPSLAQAYEEQGLSLLDLHRFAEAEEACKKLVGLRPDYAYGYTMLGFALHNLGRYEQAVASYQQMLALQPDTPEVLSDMGVSLLALKRPEEALACFNRAVALNPAIAAVQNNRGNALKELKQHEEALASYDRALALDPHYAEAHNNRALALNHLERFAEGLASVDRALALQPEFPDAHSNRGILLRGLKRYDEALASFDRAIAMRPGVGSVYWNKSMLLLLLGEYLEGWKLYEWRWKTELLERSYRALPKPLWLGEKPLAGNTILVHPEQGFGDFIQFCRYVPVLEAMGARVILEAPPALLPLARSVSPTATLVPKGSTLPPYDVHCPIMSLPHALRTTAETVPSTIPYLAVEASKQAQWSAKLGPKTRPRIGLAWSGSATHTNDHTRSMALAQLEPLLQLPAEFHSLQKELRPSDQPVMDRVALQSHADALQDFSDTAALIAQMDLVITVDTSVAHLAGALGKPVWILLANTPDYRWTMAGERTPWYPTARLFRQEMTGDWPTVMYAVIEALTQEPALAISAEGAAVHKARGVLLQQNRQYAEAVREYDQAIALASDNADSHLQRGICLRALNLFSDALASYDRAIALDPTLALAHERRAMVLVKLERYAEAVLACGQALALAPRAANVYNILARSLHHLGRYEDALTAYGEVLAIEPNAREVPSDRAVTLISLRRYEEALTNLDRAIELEPMSALLYNNRGNLLREMNRLDAAMADYDQAIALEPDLADAYWNKATLHLLRGEFTEGWALYEWRWKSRVLKQKNLRKPSEPLWLGQVPLAGKTILIHPEQGFGDFIQFCRYVPMLEAMGATVILETPAALLPLIETLDTKATLVAKYAEPASLPPFDLHCPILSLPHAFGTTLATVPHAPSYLRADAAKAAQWQELLGVKTAPRVGLVWSGSPTHSNDHARSISLAALAPILALPMGFHSLQKELRNQDRVTLASLPNLQNHDAQLQDFSDTAALVAALDLVITVDTSVAHLAGALGKPVWLMLPFIPDYRWMMGRDDSPWYPTMRLFRQTVRGGWDGVIAQVSAALAEFR